MNAADVRPRVVMLVKNSFVFDARVRKEAQSLREVGWDVHVVALHVPGSTRRRETTVEGIPVCRVSQFVARRPTWLGPATATPVLKAESAESASNRALLGRLRSFAARGARLVWPLLAPLARGLNRAIVDRRMERAVLDLRPDVVHAHDLNTLRPARRAARKSHSRLVYDAHEFHRARNGMTARERRRAARLEDRLAPTADLVVTATDSWADRLMEHWGGERPVVLRNLPPSGEPADVVDLRARLGIPAGCPVLVYLGSIQTGRGIEESMSALAHLPSSHLVVLGYGSDLPRLKRLGTMLGLSERVHFPGPVDNRDVIKWLAGADVGLCLIGNTSYSYWTSLPNKLFDYIQARIPVVASDFPEMGNVVRAWQVGEVCEPQSATAIAKAVSSILDRSASYRDPLDSAAASLTWENEVTAFLAAYQALDGTSSDAPS